jgi:hypothetical protein
MNQESKPVSFDVDGHPSEDQLLLALEKELLVEDAGRVEQHLGNCWSCRARYDEMQRGILAFVEYREKRYLPALPTPPSDTSGFRDRLRNVVHESDPVGFPLRAWRKLLALLTLPKQVKWVGAVAASMAAVIFWVHVLMNPGVVSANELLTRAVAAQNPSASGEVGARPRIAHQKMQIRGGKQTVVRDFEWRVGSPVAPIRWDVEANPAAWNVPMTAEGFAIWRASLPRKQDQVKRTGDRLTLDTTTSAGPDRIREAWIVVRAADFHPVQQHVRFTDDQELDFTELAFHIEEEPRLAIQATPPAADRSTPAQPAPPLPPPDLEETELQLRYALFSHQWDLGEDLVIGRAAGQVTLGGTVSSREREAAMRETLSTLPNVRLSLDLPGAPDSQAATSNPGTVAKGPAPSSTPLLKDVLEKQFASREERLAFVDRCLADSDAALSHAWALKRLVDTYSETEEQHLKPESDGKLLEMLRAHLRELEHANRGLESLLELLPQSKVAPPGTAANWRTGILSLFAAVQQQDRLVANLVVGSGGDGKDAAAASTELTSRHQAINALLRDLKDLGGHPIAK